MRPPPHLPHSPLLPKTSYLSVLVVKLAPIFHHSLPRPLPCDFAGPSHSDSGLYLGNAGAKGKVSDRDTVRAWKVLQGVGLSRSRSATHTWPAPGPRLPHHSQPRPSWTSRQPADPQTWRQTRPRPAGLPGGNRPTEREVTADRSHFVGRGHLVGRGPATSCVPRLLGTRELLLLSLLY